MERALYEYIIVASETNVIFHKAVTKNQRLQSGGALNTHFIEEENLMEAVKAMAAGRRERQVTGFCLGMNAVAAIAAAVRWCTSQQKVEGKS